MFSASYISLILPLILNEYARPEVCVANSNTVIGFSSFTNFSISLQKGILKRFEQLERTVSIIIQGPLHERSISTINNYLRYGEVIVSCWDTDDLSRLDNYKDKIKIVVNKYKNVKVKNKKPGKQAPWIYQNITTLSGIKKATGFFCIKVRSDESYPTLEPFISKLIKKCLIF